MIDYFALALGHGLLVLAFLRLVVRDNLDIDPAITQMKEAAQAKKPKTRANRRKVEAPSAHEEGAPKP
ncbi:hypothetical protein EH31_15460 [Erythrobacter longus]|uniref:Uncharacterized protein n=1 Tax=Erythrobacter longus TaxID=1044 RepID=A0A074M2V6_ERYLO|nr:hypothetical protein [Erythrobacter longus]KEO88831.1 hypothetical protein EH31_15460 [Erythrobacter longus]